MDAVDENQTPMRKTLVYRGFFICEENDNQFAIHSVYGKIISHCKSLWEARCIVDEVLDGITIFFD